MITRLNWWIRRISYFVASRDTPRDERERRSRSIVRGTLSAIVARGIASLTGLIMIPLTVRYLGPELYGAWMTISSVVVFFSFTDFGVAASLTNALGKAFGEKDDASARAYVSSGLFALCFTAALVICGAVWLAKPLADLVFPTMSPELRSREIVPALRFAIVLFGINFPLVVTPRVLAAYQQTATANVWGIVGNTANLIAIIIAISMRATLPVLVLASAGAGLVVSAATTMWLFGWHRPVLRPSVAVVERRLVRELFSTGWKFFVISIGILINSQTDNVVIARFLGPTEVTPYSVTFRLFAYSTLIQQFAFGSLWPAYTEAAARRDHAWIHGIYRKNLRASVLIAVPVLVMFVVFGRVIINVWAGPAAVPSWSIIGWMALWNLMLAHLYVAGCLLEATGHIERLTYYVVVTALLNVIFSVLLVRPFGATGVIAGTVVAYVVCGYPLTLLEAKRVRRKFQL